MTIRSTWDLLFSIIINISNMNILLSYYKGKFNFVDEHRFAFFSFLSRYTGERKNPTETKQIETAEGRWERIITTIHEKLQSF